MTEDNLNRYPDTFDIKCTSSHLHRDISAKKSSSQKVKKLNRSKTGIKKNITYSRVFRENPPLTATNKASGDVIKLIRQPKHH